MNPPLTHSEYSQNGLSITRSVAVVGAAFSVLCGIAALFGWLLEIPVLNDWGQGISMFPNTAVAAILAGIALLFLLETESERARTGAQICALLIGSLSGLTLLEHITGADFGIDTAIIYRPWGQRAASSPMRMGPPATVSFLLLSLVFGFATSRGSLRQWASSIALVPIAIASLSLAGYLYGADQLFGVAHFTGIALQTSLVVAVLGIAALASMPDRPPVSMLLSKDSGGAVFRKLLLPVILLPLALGSLRILGQTHGLYDLAFGTALRSLVEAIAFFALLWWTALKIRRHEAQLGQLQRTLSAIVESSNDAVIGKSLDGEIKSWNAGAARIFGFSPEEAITKNISIIIPEEQVHEEQNILKRLQAGERVEHTELIRKRADGTRINVSITVSPIWDENGKLVGTSEISRDVTERRKAEEAVLRGEREQSRELELLNRAGMTVGSTLDVEHLLQAVTDIATELSTAKYGAFFYNTTDENGDSFLLYALTGASREAFESLGKPRATPLFSPTFRGEGPIRSDDITKDSRYGKWGAMPQNHLAVRSYLAVPVVSRSGEVFGGLFFGHPEVGVFDAHHERIVIGVAAVAGVALDNARRYSNLKAAAEERERLLEAERAARSETERAGNLKDQFLANLSHELRTPLNAILGWAQLIESGRLSDADLKQAVETIKRNARAQTQLINDLLDMSRIVSGKIQLDLQSVDPAGVVDLAVESIRPAAEAKQLVLRKSIEPNTGRVLGDPVRLQQIIWNLLTNAVKFTPTGTIDVVLKRIDGHIEIAVQDTGIGIKEEFLPKVFERFRQADPSSTRAHGGLGLGLSIVKTIVDMHGGAVRAESDGESKGASFIIRLPIASPRNENVDRPAVVHDVVDGEAAFFLHNLDVLVVDDEPDARDLISRLLVQNEARVRTAKNVKEALSLFREQIPDVIVSDIGMPSRDGYELISEIRRLPVESGGRTPAVALTAFARSEDRTRALLAGYQVHLSKPIEPQELLVTIGSVAGRTSPKT